MVRRLRLGIMGDCCRLHGSSQFELKSSTGKRMMKSKSDEAMNRSCTKKRRISELLENVSTITEESAEVLMKLLPVHDVPMLSSCRSEKVEDSGRASTQKKKLILHPWLALDDSCSKDLRQPDDEELPPNLEKLLGDLLKAITSSSGDEDSASTVVDDDQDPSFVILALPVCHSK